MELSFSARVHVTGSVGMVLPAGMDDAGVFIVIRPGIGSGADYLPPRVVRMDGRLLHALAADADADFEYTGRLPSFWAL